MIGRQIIPEPSDNVLNKCYVLKKATDGSIIHPSKQLYHTEREIPTSTMAQLHLDLRLISIQILTFHLGRMDKIECCSLGLSKTAVHIDSDFFGSVT